MSNQPYVDAALDLAAMNLWATRRAVTNDIEARWRELDSRDRDGYVRAVKAVVAALGRAPLRSEDGAFFIVPDFATEIAYMMETAREVCDMGGDTTSALECLEGWLTGKMSEAETRKELRAIIAEAAQPDLEGEAP